MRLPLVFMRDTVWVRPYEGRSAQGDAQHGAPVEVPARVQPGTGYVRRSSDGAEVAVDTVVYTAAQVGPLDVLHLPGTDAQDVTTGRTPASVSMHSGRDGKFVFCKVQL